MIKGFLIYIGAYARKYEIQIEKKWYLYKPEKVLEKQDLVAF